MKPTILGTNDDSAYYIGHPIRMLKPAQAASQPTIERKPTRTAAPESRHICNSHRSMAHANLFHSRSPLRATSSNWKPP